MNTNIFKSIHIKGYEHYEVNCEGKVRNTNPTARKEFLTANVNRDGYPRYALYLGTKQKNVFAHVLVANAFIPNPDNLPTVMHIDDNPGNPLYTNLKWGTQKENMKQSGETGGHSKHKCRGVLRSPSGYLVGVDGVNFTAKKLGIDASDLSLLLRGKKNHVGGYTLVESAQ